MAELMNFDIIVDDTKGVPISVQALTFSKILIFHHKVHQIRGPLGLNSFHKSAGKVVKIAFESWAFSEKSNFWAYCEKNAQLFYAI